MEGSPNNQSNAGQGKKATQSLFLPAQDAVVFEDVLGVEAETTGNTPEAVLERWLTQVRDKHKPSP